MISSCEICNINVDDSDEFNELFKCGKGMYCAYCTSLVGHLMRDMSTEISYDEAVREIKQFIEDLRQNTHSDDIIEKLVAFGVPSYPASHFAFKLLGSIEGKRACPDCEIEGIVKAEVGQWVLYVCFKCDLSWDEKEWETQYSPIPELIEQKFLSYPFLGYFKKPSFEEVKDISWKDHKKIDNIDDILPISYKEYIPDNIEIRLYETNKKDIYHLILIHHSEDHFRHWEILQYVTLTKGELNGK